MDHYKDSGYSGTRISSTKPFEGGPSLDGIAVQSPSRLRKHKSNAGMRSVSHGQVFSTGDVRSDGATAGGFGDGAKARKGSIRNAVRKMFGRRRDVVSQGPETTSFGPASRHTYHRSEPTALVSPAEVPEPFVQDNDLMERTLAAPYQAVPSPSFHQPTASPYALQFPNSVRLKPMDLGNPFMGPPGQPRRRKTLPSIILAERDAKALAEAVPEMVADTPNGAKFEHTRVMPVPKHTLSQIKKARRKSRSADDLQSASNAKENAVRKRSEEIKYWRESFQPDVLRASGFTTHRQPVDRDEQDLVRQATDEHQDDRTTMPQVTDFSSAAASRPGTMRSSPPSRGGHGISASEGDIRPSSGFGTDMSKDLEDRVAKLEAGLHNFQRSLQRLAAERNRRTIIMGELAPQRSSNDMRSPSMLAETLADDLEPSAYEYQYGHTLRPSTSPQPPLPPEVQGSVEDPFGPELPTTGAAPSTAANSMPARMSERLAADRPTESFRMPSPLNSHPPTQEPPMPMRMPAPAPPPAPAPAPSSGSIRTTTTQPYTFNSLYQMLADERSARRKLENQLKSLRNEISDLHTQVNSSNIQSTRSSYMLAGSSSRLQDMLRETESSTSPPSGGSVRSAQRHSGLSAVGSAAPVVSRFSGSESEAGAIEEHYDELPTPQDAYRTPREERSNFSLRANVESLNKNGDMF
ncbi:hypothetical protein CLAFUW4_01046 [Fulvia fulva]|uniref:Uncharacterized protein n=1 Tax=Passalora fulva TaxID=5499 RepID=A0A9Q8L7Y4_PASFU|nr:uncharacterized protein CLAFUR5_01051 [Fulvia fulva]KAK4635654.1 hypothetical protein CLAFUR4_01047 [Fulvia fulva]KAK4638098.1 hypothetical protein CLAFUR0_01048 [Fulvia fulva]UJO12517.1 hypothetical protein CLAFUR5_01051 [Fulvia fulva]WPV08234.1 hypothetical protein CLAFUW4_01046 [Fulvia fulva]WPV23440.1 hypothetical protein CLAFUW7_01051 [Fulvia fulva]